MKTILEQRHADLAQLKAELAAEIEAGNGYLAIVYRQGIETLMAQLATYTPEKGEAHFFDSEGWTAALLAFGTVGEFVFQDALISDIEAAFEGGEITNPRLFSDIAADLAITAAKGEEYDVEIGGYVIGFDHNRLTIRNGEGEIRFMPIQIPADPDDYPPEAIEFLRSMLASEPPRKQPEASLPRTRHRGRI